MSDRARIAAKRMKPDSIPDELDLFLQKALEIRFGEPADPLTEETLKRIALKAGLTEEDWANVCRQLDGHLRKGRNFLAFGNCPDAIVELDRAAAIAPYRADVLADCGSAHAGLWRETGNRASRERAEELFRKCLEIEPDHAMAAEQLSALKKPGPTRRFFGKKGLVAALAALTCAASVWMAIPKPSGETGRTYAELPTESRPQTDGATDAVFPDTRSALDGFLGIPWGTGDEEAKAMLMERTQARYNPNESTQKRLCFDGGRFADFEVRRFTLNFENGGFYEAQVQLERRSKDHRKEFLTFKQMLGEKFGPPERNEEDADLLESTWYFQLPGQPANLINLVGDERRPGLTIRYHSGSTRMQLSGQPALPFEVPVGAKGDL